MTYFSTEILSRLPQELPLYCVCTLMLTLMQYFVNLDQILVFLTVPKGTPHFFLSLGKSCDTRIKICELINPHWGEHADPDWLPHFSLQPFRDDCL